MTPAGVEMSGDPKFAWRVARLAATSAVALWVLLYLCVTTLDANPAIDWCLAGGWVLMPTILGVSVWRPRVRYAIVLPASLVTVGLVGICATALPATATARAGWLLTTAGVLMGGVLGLWFWYRWAPVPAPLENPFSRARWSLIVVHVALVVGGLVMIAAS